MTKVCVIGAGPSGITALKNLIDQGLDVMCYDFNSDVGGNWIYNENKSHSSVFETTHIISSKTLSQYEDFTFDDFEPGLPDYPSHDQLRRYFQAYAAKFKLYAHIQFNTQVVSCELNPENQWVVQTVKEGVSCSELFTHLVVCNGHHWLPRFPSYPGNFTGEFLHSHDFKKAAPFKDKRVLVIGGGNSACDVAVETSRVSAKTTISWRRGYRIVPKFLFGKPSDVVASRFAFLPTWLKFFLSELSVKIFRVLISITASLSRNMRLRARTRRSTRNFYTKFATGKYFPKAISSVLRATWFILKMDPWRNLIPSSHVRVMYWNIPFSKRLFKL